MYAVVCFVYISILHSKLHIDCASRNAKQQKMPGISGGSHAILCMRKWNGFMNTQTCIYITIQGIKNNVKIHKEYPEKGV